MQKISIILFWFIFAGISSCTDNSTGLIKMNDDLKGLYVGIWVTPPPHLLQTTEDIEREYGRLRDAGINLIWDFWDYGEKLDDVLDVCARFGIDYILSLPVNRYGEGDLDAEINRCLDKAKKYRDHPAVIGFNMVDEPSATIFNRIALVRERVDAILPNNIHTIANLFPDYASPEQLGTNTYREHVEQYMSQVKPGILSFDHYPLSLNPQTDNYKGFIENLLVIREASFKYDVPFWGFIQAIGYHYHREPSYSEMRWLNNMHILFGAKGYSYFLYSAIGIDGGPEKFTTSALLWDGTTTPLYDMIKALNAEFAAFDRAFIQFTQDGFIPVNMEESVLSAFREDRDLFRKQYGRLVSIETDGVMLNGCFDFNGQKAVYLFNWDMNAPITASLGFDSKVVYELWGKGGIESSGKSAYLSVELEPGEGKFLVF